MSGGLPGGSRGGFFFGGGVAPMLMFLVWLAGGLSFFARGAGRREPKFFCIKKHGVTRLQRSPFQGGLPVVFLM